MRVELRTAYHWHCEKCGADNFAMPLKAEFGPDEREEAFRRFHEMDEFEDLPEHWQDFEMVTIPDQVTCRDCYEEFTTVDERQQ